MGIGDSTKLPGGRGILLKKPRLKPQFVSSSLLLSAAIVSSHSLAAGFALNENSVSSMGTAYAGRAANATNDATTIYGNPAGLTILKRPEISGGITYIHVKNDISNAHATFGGGSVKGTAKGDFVPDAYIPSFYFTSPLNHKWSYGLGIYAPFGVKAGYEKSFIGRYLAQDTELQIVNIQPTIAYKINQRWSVGLGVYGSHADGKLTQTVFDANEPDSLDGLSKVEGDDWGYGFNLGVLYQPTQQTKLGLTYHSKVDYTLKGNITQSGFSIPEINDKAKGHLDLTTPESVDLAITHDLNERWTLMAGATWTRWSRFKEIQVITDDSITYPTTEPLKPGSTYDYVPEYWKNSWSYAIGTAYKLNPKWTLRAGYAWDQSPIPDEYQSARIPTANRTWLTLGAKYDATADLSIDMALGYLVEDKVTVEDKLYQPDKTPYPGTGFYGKFKNKAIGAGLQITYKL